MNKQVKDEQGERIAAAWAAVMESQYIPSLDEFEDIFEDRDPFEFI